MMTTRAVQIVLTLYSVCNILAMWATYTFSNTYESTVWNLVWAFVFIAMGIQAGAYVLVAHMVGGDTITIAKVDDSE